MLMVQHEILCHFVSIISTTYTYTGCIMMFIHVCLILSFFVEILSNQRHTPRVNTPSFHTDVYLLSFVWFVLNIIPKF